MAKRWNVSLPVTGVLSLEVEAESEEEAIEKAMEVPYDELQHELLWETASRIVQGNVCYAMLNRPEAEELGDEEEVA